MSSVNNAFDLLVLHEGLRLKPYKCTSGKTTIGIGRNIEDNGITEEEAIHMCQNDIARVLMELAREFPWVRDIGNVRRAVYINMCFAMGLPRFKGFKKMHAAAEKKDWREAAIELLDSKWARQVKSRAWQLARIMEHGTWDQI